MNVELDGFKGIRRVYDLDGPTVLTGPNGTGKSACLEALVYALTGDVPEGRDLDRVGHYFPARGGSVTVRDDTGAWIRRGIRVDHEKNQKSEILETPEGVGRKANTAYWQAIPYTLDVRSFFSLSPKARRKFILELCGEVEVDRQAVLDAIADRYAKVVSGSQATVKTMERDDLPEEEAALARAWVTALSGALATCQEETSVAKLCLGLQAVAKERQLVAAGMARDGKAACRELEAKLEGARIAAKATKGAQLHLAVAEEVLEQAVEDKRKIETALGALNSQKRVVEERTKEHAKAAKALEEFPDPGPAPGAFVQDSAIAVLQVAMNKLREEKAAAESELTDASRWDADLGEAMGRRDDAEKRLKKIADSPHGKVRSIADSIPDDAHPRLPALKQAIHQVTADLEKDLSETHQESVRADKQVQELMANPRDPGAAEKKIESLLLDMDKHREELAELHHRAEGRRLSQEEAHAAWEKKFRKHQAAKEAVTVAENMLEQANQNFGKASQAVTEQPEMPDLVAFQAKVFEAQQKAKLAQEAQGVVSAWEEAACRAEEKKVEEKAWKIAIRAIAASAESLVGQTTQKLLADVNAILVAAGRKETAYLRLENDRGAPIFDIGWEKGESQTVFAALSGGEAAIFCAALALALTAQAEGRRLLLIEADPVDHDNLKLLLDGLPGWGVCVEALILATAQRVETASGWNVITLS